jgi:hypothetical protein
VLNGPSFEKAEPSLPAPWRNDAVRLKTIYRLETSVRCQLRLLNGTRQTLALGSVPGNEVGLLAITRSTSRSIDRF